MNSVRNCDLRACRLCEISKPSLCRSHIRGDKERNICHRKLRDFLWYQCSFPASGDLFIDAKNLLLSAKAKAMSPPMPNGSAQKVAVRRALAGLARCRLVHRLGPMLPGARVCRWCTGGDSNRCVFSKAVRQRSRFLPQVFLTALTSADDGAQFVHQDVGRGIRWCVKRHRRTAFKLHDDGFVSFQAKGQGPPGTPE